MMKLLLSINFSRKTMKKFIALLTAFASVCWSIPKPMESIKNYNVLMVHGAHSNSFF